MTDQLEEIKQKIDLVSYIAESLPLKKAGRNFKALCPFHSEKTPSFIVSAERQIWHCFGCGAGGDAFGFLMKIENLEFPEALEILAKRAGIRLVTSYQASEQAKLKEKIFKINHLASEFFHYLLLNHKSGKQALDYVLGRGVNKKSIETFTLGWAPNQWDGLSKFLLKKGHVIPELETAGLVIRGQKTDDGRQSYYDRFRGRLMFTLRDQRSNVIGFAGRIIPPAAGLRPEAEQEAKYINTSETPVYIKGNVLYGLEVTKEAIKKEDQAVIVEGEFDLISSFQAGVTNVAAIKGSALTEGQISLLKRFTQNISLALDMDLAGDSAARRGIGMADAAGFSIKVVKLPQGKDPDECARINPSLWQKAVKTALPVFDYILESAVTRFGKETADGKKKIADEVIPILSKIANPIVQAHYTSKLADHLSVSEEVIAQAAKKIAKTGELNSPARLPEGIISVSPPSRQQLLEEQLLAFILQSEEPKKVMEQATHNMQDEHLLTPAVKRVFKLLEEDLATLDKKFKVADFVMVLPQELVPLVDRVYLLDLGKILEDKKLRERELLKTINEIKKISLKKKLLALAEKIKETRKKEDIESLRQEYRQAAAELKKYQTS